MSNYTAAFLAVALASTAVGALAVPAKHLRQPTPTHAKAMLKPSPSPAPTATPNVEVPGGTQIDITLVGKVSSSNANVGDTFAIVAAHDVVLDGWVVVAKGASGQGEVVSVDRAGSNGHAGSLGLQMDWIFATDGEKIALTSQKSTEQGEGKAGAASTATIVSWAFLGLPGLFAHNFVKGRDVDVDSSKVLAAYVRNTVHVAQTQKAADEPGFAH